jgi:sugar phosphate isomerase/epimerase
MSMRNLTKRSSGFAFFARICLCLASIGAGLCLLSQHAFAQLALAEDLFAKENLVAWCIVPFDGKKRGPAERAAMLEELGIKKFAYDYRAEHIPTFEQEIEETKKRGIEITAWWFPTQLNEEAKHILSIIAKHQIKPQLWVMGGGKVNMTPEEESQFIQSEIQRLRPIADAAAELGCKVGLYNHGGWFGVPENMVKLKMAIDRPNVGIVYNLHHAHDQLERLPFVLDLLAPHLLVLNVNGMQSGGDKVGKKILIIGEGDRDEEVFAAIKFSKYRGPIGILNHTDADARLQLQANLKGLESLNAKMMYTPKAGTHEHLTLSLGDGEVSEPISAEAFRWLAGSWRGKGLGGDCVETWSEPIAGSLVGSFLFTEREKPVFSELFTISPVGNSVTLRLKHFGADMVGWEDKDKFVEFRFVKRIGNRYHFDGLTYIDVSPTQMQAIVRMKRKDGAFSEMKFEFERSK